MYKNKARKITDKLFRDDSGEIVITQFPNVTLGLWFAASVLSRLTNGRPSTILEYLGIGALLVWSMQEIFQGVNYFRRILGIVVFLFILVSRIN